MTNEKIDFKKQYKLPKAYMLIAVSRKKLWYTFFYFISGLNELWVYFKNIYNLHLNRFRFLINCYFRYQFIIVIIIFYKTSWSVFCFFLNLLFISQSLIKNWPLNSYDLAKKTISRTRVWKWKIISRERTHFKCNGRQ